MKKIYPNIIIIISCLFIFFIKNINGETKVIKMMYFSNPPFIIFDEKTGNISGATYELLENYISKELEIKFAWDKFATVVPRQLLILSKTSDTASAVLVYSAERAKNMNFTAMPYVETRSVIAVLKSNNLEKVNSVEDILNLRVGAGQGVFLSRFMRDKRIKFDFVSSAGFVKMNIKKLMNNRIDAVYVPNKFEMLYQLLQLNLENRVKIIDLPEAPIPNYVVFSKYSGDIVNRYNEAFNKLDVKNLYLKLLAKYIYL